MISTNDFRTGLTIELDGEIYSIIDFQHVKPGKGAAFVRSKLRNIRTGATTERTFRAGEKISRARLDHREMQFLYRDGENFVFMDNENYEQYYLNKDSLKDNIKYLKENMNIGVLLYQGNVIDVDLPKAVELEVVDTEPGIKGDTATGGSKAATLETGAVVQVPLFIETGNVLRIDTRNGEYIERV